MQTKEILAAIDAQIAQWQQARELIAGGAAAEGPVKRRGRPKGSPNKALAAPAKAAKRVMSSKGKARIAAAQKLRWAAQKKSANSSAKKTAPKKAAKKTVSVE